MTGISGWGIFSWEQWYQDQPFWLSGSYSRARYISQCQVTTFSLLRLKLHPPKKTHGTINFLGLCSNQQLSFFTLLDRTYFLHYNNTKIIKFGWKLFILWVISYRLSFWGFAINLSSCLETLEIGQIPKMTVHNKIHINEKFSTKFDDLDVIIMGNRCSIQQSEEINCWLEQRPLKIDCIDRSVISGPPCIAHLFNLTDKTQTLEK